ncbi:MAG: RNA-binding S4 domain-containing protein [Firmicutes bacterium]|nr:RNA-binding S4 domain-containing protein [Bacillota bacterium]
MRLDLFLKRTHLLKRREMARELCDEGMVRVNGSPRKASFEVKPGDRLEFPIFNRLLKVQILGLPESNSISKSEQWSFVEVLEEKRLSVDDAPLADPMLPPRRRPSEH